MCFYILYYRYVYIFCLLIKTKQNITATNYLTLNPEPQCTFIAQVLSLVILNKSFLGKEKQIQMDAYFVFMHFKYKCS